MKTTSNKRIIVREGDSVVDRLFVYCERFLTKGRSVPDTIRLNRNKVEQLEKETLQYCSLMPGATIVLGMRIIEYNDRH